MNPWSLEIRRKAVSYKLAVFLGLKYFAHDRHNCSILLRIDNTTAISYVNRMGGVQFPHLNDLSRQIWQWCEERNIWIFASYINTKDNIEADRESRKLNPDTEWELSNDAFRRIIYKFGHPENFSFSRQRQMSNLCLMAKRSRCDSSRRIHSELEPRFLLLFSTVLCHIKICT